MASLHTQTHRRPKGGPATSAHRSVLWLLFRSHALIAHLLQHSLQVPPCLHGQRMGTGDTRAGCYHRGSQHPPFTSLC